MLKIAGYINIMIGLAHLIGLFWAEQMFVYTGVAERMSRWADVDPSLPIIITILVAIIFIIFGLYGLKASGGVERLYLPYLKFGLFAIAGIYIARAVGGYLLYIFARGEFSTHEVLFSTIALLIGVLFLGGGLKRWGYIRCISSNK